MAAGDTPPSAELRAAAAELLDQAVAQGFPRIATDPAGLADLGAIAASALRRRSLERGAA